MSLNLPSPYLLFLGDKLALGRRTNPAIRCAGVSINTASLSGAEAEQYLRELTVELGVPVADPIRAGTRFERLIDSCLT